MFMLQGKDVVFVFGLMVPKKVWLHNIYAAFWVWVTFEHIPYFLFKNVVGIDARWIRWLYLMLRNHNKATTSVLENRYSSI